MKHLLPLLLFILTIPLYACAQDDDELAAYNDYRVGRPSLKLAVTNIINFSEALLPIGIEYRFDKYAGASVEFGIPLYFNTLANKNSKENIKTLHSDYRLRADIRAYLNPNADNLMFIGLEGIYRRQLATIEHGEYWDGSREFSYGRADIKKQIFTANVIVGAQYNISKRLYAEVQGGLGVKTARITRTNIVNESKGTDLAGKWLFPLTIASGEERKYNNWWIINIPIAFRICFRI